MRVQVELLHAGHSWQRERLADRTGSWRWIRFPATAALLRSDNGVELFDTGYSRHFFAATEPFPHRLYRVVVPAELRADDTLLEQLRRRGISAGMVRRVILSHLHGDHVAGLPDFPLARIVHGADLSGITPGRTLGLGAWRHTAHGVIPELLPRQSEAQTRQIQDHPVVDTGLPGFAEGFDLGNGVIAVELPGHTEGHYGLWIPHTQGPPVLLVADAVWLASALQQGHLPPGPVLRVMADPRAYCRTVERLAEVASLRPDILLVPSHCEATLHAARRRLGQ